MTSPRLLHLAALVEVLALLPAVLFVFLGATIHTCLGGGTNCGQPVMVVPLIRTNEGMVVSLAVCALAWIAANYVVLAHLARFDRPRLLRVAVVIGIAAVAMAAVGFVLGLQVRLRYAGEGGITWGLAGVVLGWIIAVAWVGLRPGAIVQRVTPSSMGRQ
ncbi:MAG TPA: hypothetical protein VGQ58_00385 [Candidatus Limnocylindrales bacterium]|jgi:hypothetical protein|nr:hypothetical protein [Candidatus Limnocylindrales bacterium]